MSDINLSKSEPQPNSVLRNVGNFLFKFLIGSVAIAAFVGIMMGIKWAVSHEIVQIVLFGGFVLLVGGGFLWLVGNIIIGSIDSIRNGNS